MGQTPEEQAFHYVSEEARLSIQARFLDEEEELTDPQRKDICERVRSFVKAQQLCHSQVSREVGINSTILAQVLAERFHGTTLDRHLARLHNWLELAARRADILGSRSFVETSVAREILSVARVVCDTCKMGVVFGPAQIGKTMTLKAIVGLQSYGDPVLVRVTESTKSPAAFMRSVCDAFDLITGGRTFDRVFLRAVKRLKGTRRMIMVDEAERLNYQALETLRDLHDETGCPVLLAGKPAVYSKLGFRSLGDYSEVTDQLASRLVIRRDLTERTRTGEPPQPLYSLEDVRKLIERSGLKLHVTDDAKRWLQGRAGALGLGGLGTALVKLYLAAKVAYVKGDPAITVAHLESVEGLTTGPEDQQMIDQIAAQGGGLRRVI
jgi:DNA transposition AAA+ family ATPase